MCIIHSVKIRVYLPLFCALAMWASAFAGIRAGLEAYSPGHLALLRFLIASAALGVIAVVMRIRKPAWRDVPLIFLTGALGTTIYHVALCYGERTVTAGAASFIVNTGIVFAAIFAGMFLKERIGGKAWLGIATSFAGVTLIAIGEGGTMEFTIGALYILVAALASSLYHSAQKVLLRTYGAFETTCHCTWAGTVLMLVLWPGLIGEVRNAPVEATLAVAYLGVFPAAIGYVIWVNTLKHLHVGRATSFLYLVPGMALVIGWVWLGEVPHWLSLAGGLLALAGVVVVSRAKHVVEIAGAPEAGE